MPELNRIRALYFLKSPHFSSDNYLSKESKYYPKIEKLIRIKVPVYTVRVSSDGDDPLELYMYTNMDNLDIELPKEVYMINE